MKKRIFALALALCMMLSVMPTSFATGILTVDGQQPQVQEQEQPRQDGILSVDGLQPEEEKAEEPEEEEPVYGVLTPDAPAEEPKAPVVLPPVQETPSQPDPGILAVVCEVCGYYDGYHADDCATQQPQEEPVVTPAPVVTQPTVSVPQEPVVSNYAVQTVSSTPTARTLNVVRNAAAYNALSLMATGDEGEDPYAVMPVEDERVDNSSVVTTKEVKKDSQGNLVTDADGNYIIRLEAYVTGQTTTTETVKADDMDIILILDTSREMITKTGNFETVTNYVEIGSTPRNVYDYRNQGVYYKNAAGDYISVTVTRSDWNRTYYVHVDGNQIDEASGWNDTFSNTYYYRTQTQVDVGDRGLERLAALKTAAIDFIDAIAPDDATENDRRVALISYNSYATVLTGEHAEGSPYADENDAVDSALRPVLSEKDMLEAEIRALQVDITAAAYCETALYDAKQIFQNGHTLDEPVPTDRPRIVILLSAGVFGPSGQLNDRDTDGYTAMDMIWLSVILKTARGTTVEPDFGSNFYGFADRDAYSFSNTYGFYDGCGATVYCVGLGMPTTEPTGAYTTTGYGTIPSRINEVMYRVSSHRPDGTHTSKNMYNPWESLIANSAHKTDDWEGTYPDALTRNVNKLNSSYTSYFLTADDASELSGIFNTISDSIQSGSASVTLDTTTTVTDVVSDYFQLPKDNNGNVITSGIKVYTADYTSSKTWAADVESNLEPEVGDNSITVSGFDFSKNYVDLDAENGRDENDPSKSGNFYGRKLIIEIPFKVADDFLGGVEVPTNTTGSAIVNGGVVYEEFDPPTVTIPVDPEKVENWLDWEDDLTINSQTIYLSNEAVLNGMLSAKAGSKLDGVNNAFVDTVFTVKQGTTEIGTYTVAAGKTVDEGSWTWKTVEDYGVSIKDSDEWAAKALTDCTDYTITCAIDSNPVNGSHTVTVHVLVPDHDFADAVMYLSNEPDYTKVTYTENWIEQCDDCVINAASNKPAVTCQTGDYLAGDLTLTTCNDVTPYITLVGDNTIEDIVQDAFKLHVLIPTVSFQNATIHLGTTPNDEDYDTKCYKAHETIWSDHASEHAAVSDLINIGTEIAATDLTFAYDVGGTDYKDCYNVVVTDVKIGGGTYDEFVAESPAFMIHVLQPVVNVALEDVKKYYGEQFNIEQGELTLQWLDKNATAHTADNVMDTAPYTKTALEMKYTPSVTWNGYVPNKDVTVAVEVWQDDAKFTGQTTITTTCENGCDTVEKTDGTGAYIIHVETCTLTVANTGWDELDVNQSFIFNVVASEENNIVLDDITVVIDENGSATIVGLPVGEYTVSADSGDWSWRYETTSDSDSYTVSATKPNGEVIMENNRTEVKWFDAIAETVKNIFGKGDNE